MMLGEHDLKQKNCFFLFDVEYSFNDNYLNYIKIYREIAHQTEKTQQQFRESCKKQVHNFDELYTVGLRIFSESLEDIIRTAVGTISQIRNIDISTKKFLEVSMRNGTMPVEDVLNPLMVACEKVSNYVDDIKLKRHIERGTRSEWIGGGFGINGGILGVIQAGALNYVTNSIRDVSDSYTDENDLSEIQALKDKIYNEKCIEGQRPLDYLDSCLEKLSDSVYIEMCNILGIDTLDYEKMVSENISNRLYNCYPVERSKVLTAIYSYPFYVELYFQIWLMEEKSYSELMSLAEFVGIKSRFKIKIVHHLIDKYSKLRPGKNDSLEVIRSNSNLMDEMMKHYSYLQSEPLNNYGKYVKQKLKEMEATLSRVNNILSIVSAFQEEKTKIDRFFSQKAFDVLWDIAKTSQNAYTAYKLRGYYENLLDFPPFTSPTDVLRKFEKEQLPYLNNLKNQGNDAVDYVLAYYNWKCNYAEHRNKNAFIYHIRMNELAEKGDLFVLWKIGHQYVYQNDASKSKKEEYISKGIKYIQQAAWNLDPSAMRDMGSFCYLGIYGIKLDKSLSAAFYDGASILDPTLKEEIEGDKSSDKDIENGRGGGCFITTAVCDSFGKPDDCYELTMFRQFRDTWLRNQEDGEALIKEYYAIAPRIVSNINLLDNAREVYRSIWANYLKPCLVDLESDDKVSCKKRYIQMVMDLKEKYLK